MTLQNAFGDLNLEATQVDILATLESLDNKINTLGQKVMAGSQSVVMASDHAPVPTQAPVMSQQTYSQAGVIDINTVLMTLDCQYYGGAVALQVSSLGSSGVITCYWSQDGTLHGVSAAYMIRDSTTASATTISAAATYRSPTKGRYLIVKLTTAVTAGTTEITATLIPEGTCVDPYTTVQGNLSTVSNVTTVATVSAVTSVASSNTGAPSITTDISSGSITSTATTGNATPTSGSAYKINIPVTAVSGTNPTLDIAVEESDDSATNWYRVYEFPRITATGVYRSPLLKLRGNKIRYVQTVGGTTPSFTRAIFRLQLNDIVPVTVGFIDRTIVPNTLNSTSPTYVIDGCVDFNAIIHCTAQTNPATMAMQFSMDGTNWFTSATTVNTAVGVVQAKYTNEQWKFGRLIVTSAGTGITLGSATIQGIGR